MYKLNKTIAPCLKACRREFPCLKRAASVFSGAAGFPQCSRIWFRLHVVNSFSVPGVQILPPSNVSSKSWVNLQKRAPRCLRQPPAAPPLECCPLNRNELFLISNLVKWTLKTFINTAANNKIIPAPNKQSLFFFLFFKRGIAAKAIRRFRCVISALLQRDLHLATGAVVYLSSPRRSDENARWICVVQQQRNLEIKMISRSNPR